MLLICNLELLLCTDSPNTQWYGGMPEVPGPHKTANVKLSTLHSYQSFRNVDVKICKGNCSSLELSVLLILPAHTMSPSSPSP